MSDEIRVSVVIPAYNEAARLRKHVPGIVAHLAARNEGCEIIVVNDGSRDHTVSVVQELAKIYPIVRLVDLQRNYGKGGAVKAGMLAARGRHVLFTDADQSAPIGEGDKLLRCLQTGYDMAIGSRRMPGAEVEQRQAWPRALAGRLFGIGTQLLCIRGIYDTQCGIKAMTRNVAQRVLPQVTSNTAIFDVEMLVVATREGYRIAELPVRWMHDPDTRIPYDFLGALRVWAELFRIWRVQGLRLPLKAKT